MTLEHIDRFSWIFWNYHFKSKENNVNIIYPRVEKNGADSIKNVFILVVVSKLGNRRFRLWLVNYGGSYARNGRQSTTILHHPLSVTQEKDVPLTFA